MGDITDHANAIIPDYNLRLHDQMTQEDVFFGRLKRNKEGFARGTQNYITGVQFDRSEGNAAVGEADDASLPTASDPAEVQSTTTPKLHFMTFNIYPASRAKFQSGKAFISNLLGWKIENTQLAMTYRCNQDALSAGNAVRALVNGDPGTGTTITFDSRFGQATFGTGDGTNPHDLFGKNMRVDFINPGTGAVRSNTPSGGYKITAIDETNQTFTISSAADASIADNDYIVRYGEYNNGVTGLLKLVGGTEIAATVQGVNASTNTDWQSTRLTNSNNLRPLTEALLNSACTKVRNKTGKQPGGGDYCLFGRSEAVDEFSQVATSAQRLKPREAKLGAEIPTFQYRGHTWKPLEDPSAMPERLWGLDEKDLSVAELEPMQWYRENGSYLTSVASTATSAFLFRGTGFGWWNLHIKHRNRHFVIEDLNL